MSSKRIVVNPEVLKWARETAHMGVSDVPKTLISHEKLLKIESGKELPTLSVLEKLAKKYDRALYTLLEGEIPKDDYLELPFFRKLNKTNYDFALALFIRDVQKKQDWARNYLLTEGYGEMDFIGSMKLSDDYKKVANKMKERLSLPSFLNFRKRKEAYFKAIKEELEKNHIFVSITGSDRANKSIGLEDAQGFAIVDKIAPFIFVNTKNTTNAKIFTVIHETVHLFLAESGISEDSIKFRKPECHEDAVENFCNMVASEVLMPEDIFREKMNEYSGLPLKNRITSLSEYFLVSELAVCVRLWKLKLIEFKVYEQIYSDIKKRIDEFLKEHRKKQKELKGGNYYASMASKNGKMLSQIAYYAYRENKILGTDLYKLLRIKLDKLNTYNTYFLAV
jgi:Zn-dependent peptidase ImmA (M78 family)